MSEIIDARLNIDAMTPDVSGEGVTLESALSEMADETAGEVEEAHEIDETTTETDESGDSAEESGEDAEESVEKADSDAEEESEESPEDETEESDESKKKKDLKKELEATKPAKLIKVAVGKDKTLEIPQDAVFTVKVDGETKSLTTRQLIDQASSSMANHKYTQKVQKMDQEVQGRAQALSGIVEEFAQMVDEGKAIPAIGRLVMATGRNPLTVVRALREAVLTTASEWLNLTEDQQRAINEAEEKEYYKMQVESFRGQEASRREQTEQQKVVSEAASRMGITRDEYDEWHQKTVEYVSQGQKAGKIDPTTKVTPQVVEQYYTGVQKSNELFSVLQEHAPQILKDEAELVRLTGIVKRVDPSKEELIEVISEMYGSSAKKNQVVKTKAGNSLKVSPNSLVKPAAKQALRSKDNGSDPGLDIDRTPVVRNWREHI